MFVGRERELRELRAGLDGAFAGRGVLILVAGEPGIGKTSLANEFGREAVARGARMLRGGNFEGGGAPAFWPWVQVLRTALTNPALARVSTDPMAEWRQAPFELRDLLPEPTPAEGLEPELARFRLFDAVASVLRSACATQPVVVVLDDLQWADQSSLLLLQFLGRELAATGLVLLGLYRDVEPNRPPEIATRLTSLACDARAITLAGLTPPEVAGFVESATRRAVSDTIVTALHGATGGNPLFVDELVRSLTAEGRLDESVATRLPLPERVRAVMRRRTDDLSEACRQVLAVAALVGRDFDLTTVAHALRRAGRAHAAVARRGARGARRPGQRRPVRVRA